MGGAQKHPADTWLACFLRIPHGNANTKCTKHPNICTHPFQDALYNFENLGSTNEKKMHDNFVFAVVCVGKGVKLDIWDFSTRTVFLGPPGLGGSHLACLWGALLDPNGSCSGRPLSLPHSRRTSYILYHHAEKNTAEQGYINIKGRKPKPRSKR